jgi:hypothetical protein
MGPMRLPRLRDDDHRMKKLIAVIGLALLAIVPAYESGASASYSGDVVRAWNDQALNTVRAKSATDAVAARAYAMVNAAIYDAVNGLSAKKDRRTSAIVAPAADAKGDPVAAAAQAAHDVLVGLFPDRVAFYDAQLAADLASAGSDHKVAEGRTWGSQVASAVLNARANDGSSPNEPQAGDPSMGHFPTSWNGTQFRHLAPFAIADPSAYTGAAPPALSSLDYATAFNEVKVVGSAANPDPSKDATFNFWKLPSGSNQPAGAWLQVAQAVSASRSLSLEDTARLFALQSMAMADVVAPTVMTKWTFHSWRPVSAINQADSDPNPLTSSDPNGTWVPRGGSSGNPEYFSGHSSFSSAGAQVLAGFFCSDHIAFTLTTDFPGSTRTYSSFSSAAAEAGRSRVVGGLHFEFSNQAAGASGRAVADEVLGHSLLRTAGATHHGDCPL